MYVRVNQLPVSTPIPGIDHVTLAGGDEGLRNLSVWRQFIVAGGATPPHRHSCEEVVLCLAGVGELHIGGRSERFCAGQTLVIPPNVDHQIVSVGPSAMDLIGIFSMSPVPTYMLNGDEIELPWRT